MDRDTAGVPGSPPLVETIFSKVDRATAFLSDLSYVGTRADGRRMPNPNVLLEHGWALRALSWRRIISVMNVAYGHPDEHPMPFDLQHFRRPILYDCPDDASNEQRAAARESLAVSLRTALRAILDDKKLAIEPAAALPDPIRLTRHVELVRPGDIVGNEIGELFLHAETGTDTGKRPAPHPVTIIAFTPELDPVLGLYCDIRLANPQGALFSYMPFIQLGLARYQEHAVEALKLSHPVQCMVQILPDRAGYVQISGPTSVKVVVSGPAFGSMEDEYHRMRLNVRLMERIPLPGGGEGSWRPARGGDNRDVVMLDQRPNGAIDDELWSIELTLPASHMGTHYGLLIEEYEMLPADPVEQVENAPRGADPLEGTQLFQRGPLFQTTVDLRQPNDPYEGA
ncbi:hypothetical protein [Sphingomonas koreensis]|uniref:hypothetical protein n=1 Tax=Sphingomonas koreensis TaxID=93064 RepID=UPI000F7DCB8B|nr:hypothetical protein [Sphingomonas koreensis]